MIIQFIFESGKKLLNRKLKKKQENSRLCLRSDVTFVVLKLLRRFIICVKLKESINEIDFPCLTFSEIQDIFLSDRVSS